MSCKVTHPGSRSCVQCRGKWLSGRPCGKQPGCTTLQLEGSGKAVGWSMWLACKWTFG